MSGGGSLQRNVLRLPAFDTPDDKKTPGEKEYERRYGIAGRVFDAAGDGGKIEDLLEAIGRKPEYFTEWHNSEKTILEVAVCLLLEMPRPGTGGHDLWRQHEPMFQEIVDHAICDWKAGQLAVEVFSGARLVKPADFLAWAAKSGYLIPNVMADALRPKWKKERGPVRNARFLRRIREIYNAIPPEKQAAATMVNICKQLEQEEQGRSGIKSATLRTLFNWGDVRSSEE
ncbi:MAG: hypothetical protein HZA24_07415 [Nitrospirae bacterium]|nr:hypothetical protein [Nitrospirota bacterium]